MRNCYGSDATIWVAPDETARCPQCRTPATVYRHSLGGGYRVVAAHLPPVNEQYPAGVGP